MNLSVLKITLIVFIIIYTASLIFIFLYSLVQGHLLIRYLKSKKRRNVTGNEKTEALQSHPHVTIQLPLFNEKYVAERLIDAVASIKYPKDKLEIQILDDSTDETIDIVKKKVEEWRQKGTDIVQVIRENREEYKAGALKYGLNIAKGELIAIFDADFIPSPGFLESTVPHFSDSKIGMVQTRWGHINKDYSLLTRLQAFALDAHFTVEQTGRNYQGSFINFNGTGGIWRKTCILDAGNWEGDTLTEDLDLSYRAQLKGWKFKYLQQVESPAELPPVMSALKSQQRRWNKGGSETAKKHLKTVLKSNISSTAKWHATFHLLNTTVFLSILFCALSSIPILIYKPYFSSFNFFFKATSIFFLSFLIISLQYLYSNSAVEKKKYSFFRFLFYYPCFLSVSMGLSLHNSIAVIEGYMGRKTPFIRTPKFNIKSQGETWKKNQYIQWNLNLVTFLELLLAIYFAFGVIYGLLTKEYLFLGFHIMLTFGFSAVFYFSLIQKKS